MLNKRGISPLIATVLIIGFTVALSAIIITWGTGFTKGMQIKTEETAQRQVVCSTEVMIDIKNAQVIAGNKIRLLIENSGGRVIDKFSIRIYGSSGIDSAEINSSLDAYGIQSFEVPFNPTIIGEAEEIEAFPSITFEGEAVVCSNCNDKEIISACESWSCNDWSTCPPLGGTQTRTCTDANNCGTNVSKPPESQSCNCNENWNCTGWGSCVNGQQNRTCTDANNCGTVVNKPATTQSCTCDESWNCTGWGSCVNGQQNRTCTDANNCGTAVNKPATTQSCCEEVWSCGNWGSCTGSGETGAQNRTCTDANNCGTTTNKPATTQSCSRVVFSDEFNTFNTADWTISSGGDVQNVNGEMKLVGKERLCVYCSNFYGKASYLRSKNPTLKVDFKVNTVSTGTIFHVGSEGTGAGNSYRRHVIIVWDGYIQVQWMDDGATWQYQTIINPAYANRWYTLEIEFSSSGSKLYVYSRSTGTKPATPLHTMTKADWNPNFHFWIYKETGYIDNAIVLSDHN